MKTWIRRFSKKYQGWFLTVVFLLLFVPDNLIAVPIDLSTFRADQGVTVNQSTGVVTFIEYINHISLNFENAQFFVANDATILSFYYSLAWGPDDADDYLEFLVNYSPEFLVSTPQSGLFTYDLQLYRGVPISLSWWLICGGSDTAAGSSMTIFAIDLANTGVPGVPEPATMLLLGSGLLGLAGLRKKLHK